jgi:hypothetical protein
MRFWHAAALTNNGRFKEALPLFGKVFSEDDNWREFVVRIAPLGLLRVNDKQLKRILRM